MSLRFAFYGRVSTEDAQDPEASRSWQKRRAMDLITPHGGFIAEETLARELVVGSRVNVPDLEQELDIDGLTALVGIQRDAGS